MVTCFFIPQRDVHLPRGSRSVKGHQAVQADPYPGRVTAKLLQSPEALAVYWENAHELRLSSSGQYLREFVESLFSKYYWTLQHVLARDMLDAGDTEVNKSVQAVLTLLHLCRKDVLFQSWWDTGSRLRVHSGVHAGGRSPCMSAPLV